MAWAWQENLCGDSIKCGSKLSTSQHSCVDQLGEEVVVVAPLNVVSLSESVCKIPESLTVLST